MTGRVLTQESEEVILRVKKVGVTHVAKELGVTYGSLTGSMCMVLKKKRITDGLLFRLQRALDNLEQRKIDDYNDGNNPSVLLFLEALVKKYSGETLRLEQYDCHVRDFLDLTEKYGEVKGFKMALILLQG